MGYSLPDTDSYVRYLLKSAVIEAPRLKRIDVLCRDEDGRVKGRYDAFVAMPFYRFRNLDMADYLETVFSLTIQRRSTRFRLDRLEEAHESLFYRAEN